MSYDTSKEITLQGTVSSVNTRGGMVDLTLQTTSKGVDILVGPDFILKAKSFTLAAGDEISVICAPIGRGYMARQITRGSETLTLLDANGQPAGGPGEGRSQSEGPQGPPQQ